MGDEITPSEAAKRDAAEVFCELEPQFRRRMNEVFSPTEGDTETALLARLEALEAENARLLTVIADAIRRPMGVVPNSADGLLTQADLERAEQRRVHRPRRTEAKE